MKGYPLITKSQARRNASIKHIQKAYQKQYRHIKGRFPKARISKVVALRSQNSFYDLSNKQIIKKAPEDLNIHLLLEEFKEKGICGLSGSGFQTDKKVKAVVDAKVKEKVLIINAVACDPGLIHDDWLIKHELGKIEKGIALLNKYIGFNRIILATKEKIDSKNYEICLVPNRYPMGAEKILINHVLGKNFAFDEIPAMKGILMLNVQTIYAIYEAIYEGIVANTRLITVADLSTGEALVARVNVGDKVIDILGQTLGKRPRLTPCFGEGIMMGRETTQEDEITLTTNFIGYGEAISYDQEARCRRCGACSRKCPMQIRVDKIIAAIEKNNLSIIKELHPENCIQCGACTYHCKAGKNTMALVEELKS